MFTPIMFVRPLEPANARIGGRFQANQLTQIRAEQRRRIRVALKTADEILHRRDEDEVSRLARELEERICPRL